MNINSALLTHLFPHKDPTPTSGILHPFRDVSLLGPEEIASALAKSSNSSAPGPDQVPYWIWKKVNKANLCLILALLSPLILYGFQPAFMKETNGILLSKPGKPDNSASSLFRVIVLLQMVSKILERTIASYLSPLIRMVGLVKRNQCGSLPGLSMFDVCVALVHKV